MTDYLTSVELRQLSWAALVDRRDRLHADIRAGIGGIPARAELARVLAELRGRADRD